MVCTSYNTTRLTITSEDMLTSSIRVSELVWSVWLDTDDLLVALAEALPISVYDLANDKSCQVRASGWKLLRFGSQLEDVVCALKTLSSSHHHTSHHTSHSHLYILTHTHTHTYSHITHLHTHTHSLTHTNSHIQPHNYYVDAG